MYSPSRSVDADYGHIVVPMDFSPTAVAAFRRACDLSRGLDARVTLLHVTAPPPQPTQASGLDAIGKLHDAIRVACGYSREHADARLQPVDAERKLAALRLAPYADGVPVETVQRRGPAGDEILNYVREQRATLVMLGAPAAASNRAWARKETLNRVLREAPCPVMLVRLPETELSLEPA